MTDANLLLGRIEPNAFAEGKMKLNTKAAEGAMIQDVSQHLDISASEGAFGVTEMVEENMANAARIHSVEHGVDLSHFSMIAFGGGGPLHAVRLAEKARNYPRYCAREFQRRICIGFSKRPRFLMKWYKVYTPR